jgi:hypothetical protein
MNNSKFQGPLVIVGLSRSGTKLLRDLLNKNESISIPEIETHFVPEILGGDYSISRGYEVIKSSLFTKRYPEVEFPSLDELNKIVEMNSNAHLVESVLKYYAPQIGSEWKDGMIWGDKTPLYLRSVDLLRSSFPNCRVVHIVRDPRDRAFSVRKAWQKSIYRATEKWREELVATRKWKSHSNFFLEVSYESLVLDPESALKKVCGFLGIDFDSNMLTLAKPAEKFGNHSESLKVRTDSVSSFKSQSEHEVKRIEEIAYPMMKEFEYQPLYATDFVPYSRFLNLLSKFSDYILFKYNVKRKGY